MRWCSGRELASTSWKAPHCAQELTSCRYVVVDLEPVRPGLVYTGVPAQPHGPPPSQLGAKRRCDVSRHEMGWRAQQPLAQEHELTVEETGGAVDEDGGP